MRDLALVLAATLSLSASTPALAQTVEDPPGHLPTPELRTYEFDDMTGHLYPMSGPVRLSRTVARFADFSGEMELEYVGQMPPGDFETGSAWVYRVRNARQYAALNGDKDDWPCFIHYLTIQERGGASIRLGALEPQNWREYSASRPGLCFGYSYMLRDAQ